MQKWATQQCGSVLHGYRLLLCNVMLITDFPIQRLYLVFSQTKAQSGRNMRKSKGWLLGKGILLESADFRFQVHTLMVEWSFKICKIVTSGRLDLYRPWPPCYEQVKNYKSISVQSLTCSLYELIQSSDLIRLVCVDAFFTKQAKTQRCEIRFRNYELSIRMNTS